MAEEEEIISTRPAEPDKPDNAENKMPITFITMVIVIVIDQITKRMAVAQLSGEPPRFYLNEFLILTYTENHGAFLSLGATWPPLVRRLVFIVLVIGFLLYFLIFLMRETHLPGIAFMFGGLVLGGGIGNLIDRIVNNGGVIDFLLLRVGNVQTGIFNVADMGVMAGVVGLIIFGSAHPPPTEPEPEPSEKAEDSLE